VQHDRNKLIARKLAPIKQIMALYSVRNPKQFAFKIDKLVQHSLGNKVVLNPRERKALGLLNRFMTDNKKQIQALVNDNTKALKKINKNISTNESKRIIKARRRLINERIEVKGVKRPLTNNEIATRLRSEFKDDSARLERILQTEVHRQDELVKEVSARGLGFKFKTWNTQRDSRVRETHAVLDRKKIRINDDFNVGGHRASFPSDPRLPPDESINCRCFLTFSN
jgi:virulence-associated protein VagC